MTTNIMQLTKTYEINKPIKYGFISLIVLINLFNFFNKSETIFAEKKESLYLMEKASMFVTDEAAFEQKVREVSARLDIPPEWLMSVMYSESRFDHQAENLKGSGAVGLIQFMPLTMPEFGLNANRLKNMSHVEQLEYVYEYMKRKSVQYGGLKSLCDTYLAILYPKAIGKEPCYTLYSKPSRAYKQNIGLDEDKDGRVTVSDIEKRMKRLFPKAYITKL